MEENSAPDEEEIAGPIPAGLGFGTIPLSAMLPDDSELIREIESFDPLRLAACFSGLLTEPALQSNCVRLEALVHICFALARGTQKPNEKIVSRLFRAISPSATMLEDPAEDIFVSLIVTPRGNFRVLEGIWESAGFHTQRIVSALDLIPQSATYDELRERVYAMLKLSDFVCERAGLARYQDGNAMPEESIPAKVLGRLKSLRRNIRFTKNELIERGIDLTRLAEYGFDVSERANLMEGVIGHSKMERSPIVFRNDEFYLLLPTAVTSAIRRFIIESMESLGKIEVFSRTVAFELAQMFHRTPLLGDRSGAPIQFQKTNQGLLAGAMYSADRGRFVNFIFFVDTLEHFDDNGGLVGLYPTAKNQELEKQIERWIDESHAAARKQPDFKEGISLVIGCGIGRALVNLAPERKWENWRVEAISAPDLFTLSWISDFKPLSLFRLLDGRDRVERVGVNLFNINGLLNLVAWARSLNGHLVPHANVPIEFGQGGPSLLLVEQNAILKVRKEVSALWDYHACPTVDQKWIATRKEGEATFEEDRSRPFYVTEQSQERWPLVVYETAQRAWWVQLETSDTTTGHWAYQRHQMLKTWICLAAPVLEDSFSSLPLGPLLCRVRFEGDIGDRKGFEARPFLTVEQTLPFIETAYEAATISFVVKSGFEDAIFNPVNVAEHALVIRLVETVAQFASVPLELEARDAIVSRIVAGPNARQSHAFMARNFRDYVKNTAWSSPIKIDVDDSAAFKLGLGWRTRDRSEGGEIKGREACTSYLNGIVKLIEDEVCTDLRGFDRRSVIMFGLMNHENAISDRDNWRRTSPAVVALHRDMEATLATISDHESELNAIFLASRLLVEFAICECPLEGGAKPGDLDMSRIMAKIVTACGLGGWSDSIHWQAMEPSIWITPLGDIHAKLEFQEEVLNPYSRVASDLNVDESTKNYERNLANREIIATEDLSVEPEFLEAFEEQFGASLNSIRMFLDHLENLGIDKNEIVFPRKRSELLAATFEGNPIQEAPAIVAFLTLKPRPSWRFIPEGLLDKDIFPWRFRRRLAVLRRPLIQLDESDDPTFLIAPGILRDAFLYMFRNYHTGDFPRWQLSPKMKRWAGKARDQMGKKFSGEVAARLKELGWEVETEIRITKLLGKGFDQDYGDIDVLAWKAGSNRVLLIECKDVQHKKTEGEVAEQLLDFRGELNSDGKPDFLLKHLNRIDVIASHIPQVTKYLKLNSDAAVEGYLVFKHPVPMKFAWERMRERITLRLFSELETI